MGADGTKGDGGRRVTRRKAGAPRGGKIAGAIGGEPPAAPEGRSEAVNPGAQGGETAGAEKPPGGGGGDEPPDGFLAPIDPRVLDRAEQEQAKIVRGLIENQQPQRTARWVRETLRSHLVPDAVARLYAIGMGITRFPVATMVGSVVYVPASAGVQAKALTELVKLGVPAQLGLVDMAGDELPAAIALPMLQSADGREAVPVIRGADGGLVYDGTYGLGNVEDAELAGDRAGGPYASPSKPDGVEADEPPLLGALRELAAAVMGPPPGAPERPAPPPGATPEVPLEYVEVDETPGASLDGLDAPPDAHRVPTPERAVPIDPALVASIRARAAARRRTEQPEGSGLPPSPDTPTNGSHP